MFVAERLKKCLNVERKLTMNKKQKEFLKDLKTLCDKYHIDTMLIQGDYIAIFSNGELLAFRNYVNGEFRGIMTSASGYEVEE